MPDDLSGADDYNNNRNKVHKHVMLLNHPESIAPPPPWSVEKFMKAVPHAKKDGDL